MAIRVEFYGIARQRAGTAALMIPVPHSTATLGEVLALVTASVPALGEELLRNGQLSPSLTANIDGQRFVGGTETPIRDGQSLLLLSADAGG